VALRNGQGSHVLPLDQPVLPGNTGRRLPDIEEEALFAAQLRFPLFSLAAEPFVRRIAHGLFRTILEPGHERAVEPKCTAAFAREKRRTF